jgi:hypothetical protein
MEMPKLEPSPTGGLTLQNASLREVIDILAQRLKINYILDPRVNWRGDDQYVRRNQEHR